MNEEKLIKCVRAHECLYNMECIDYGSNLMKKMAWEKIAYEMGARAADCKTNWYQLRNSFRNAVARRVLAGRDSVSSKRWIFEDQMSFILPFVLPRQTSFNGMLNQHGKRAVDEDNETRERKIEKPRTKLQNLDDEVSPLEKTSEMITQDTDGQDKDDIDLFFESLAKTVKKLPKLERIKLKINIMKILNEVETRCLEGKAELEVNTVITYTHSAQVAHLESDTTKDIYTVNSRSASSSCSSSPSLVLPEQSYTKCKQEPSDNDQASESSEDCVSESIESDPLIAHTSNVKEPGETVATQHWPRLTLEAASDNTVASIANPRSLLLPYVVSVESLSTCEENVETNN